MTTITQTGKHTSTNRPITTQKNQTKQINKQNKIIIIKLKLNKIIQLLTVLQELVTLDGSLAHVIQAPNTQPYHS